MPIIEKKYKRIKLVWKRNSFDSSFLLVFLIDPEEVEFTAFIDSVNIHLENPSRADVEKYLVYWGHADKGTEFIHTGDCPV